MATMMPALRSTVDRLREEIDNTFDRWLAPRSRGETETTPTERMGGWDLGLPTLFGTARPVLDMDEDENEIRVTAELPGMEKDDFKVELMGNQLRIRGEKKLSREEKKRNYYYSELNYGSFSRAVTLPAEVEPDKIDANYKNGILTVRLPKTQQSKAKPIDVKIE